MMTRMRAALILGPLTPAGVRRVDPVQSGQECIPIRRCKTTSSARRLWRLPDTSCRRR